MKNIFLIITAAILLLAFKSPGKKISTWELDKTNSKLGFSIARVVLSAVRGQVKYFSIKVTASKEDFSDGVVEMSADVSSITTGVPKRDVELKGPNYFDQAKFPTLTFKSNSFKKIDDRNYKVLGVLTMHGISKAVTLDVIYTKELNTISKKAVARFKSSCKINREDFRIGSGTSSSLVSKDVYIFAETEFIKMEALK